MTGSCRVLLRPACLLRCLPVVAAVLLSGCGYSTRSLLPEGVSSVAVEIFGNETFDREIEFTLTRELAREIRHRTAWRVADRGAADALIRGRITRVQRPVLVEDRRDRISEGAVIVTVEVELVDLATGRLLVPPFELRNRAEFLVERGETVETAFAESLADLAEDIVNEFGNATYDRDLEAARSAVP